MKKIDEFNFVKSYPILRKLPITRLEKELIELILSYQSKGLSFFMSYSSISEELDVKIQSIKNMVSKLKKLGYLFTEHKSNFNGINGGSSTTLKINLELIEKHIDELTKITESVTSLVIEPVQKEIEPINEVDEEENDGFSDPELARLMAESLQRKLSNPIPKKQDKKVVTINNVFEFEEDCEEDYHSEIPKFTQQEEQSDNSITVKPENKDISIESFFSQIKEKIKDRDVANKLDLLKKELKDLFDITMLNDLKLKDEKIKEYYNKQIQFFKNNRFKYLKLF